MAGALLSRQLQGSSPVITGTARAPCSRRHGGRRVDGPGMGARPHLRVCAGTYAPTAQSVPVGPHLIVNISDGSRFVDLSSHAAHASLKSPSYRLSALRPVPEALQAGPAGGESVSEFPPGGEGHEVLQLHPGQQPAPATHLHARHVVSGPRPAGSGPATRGALGRARAAGGRGVACRQPGGFRTGRAPRTRAPASLSPGAGGAGRGTAVGKSSCRRDSRSEPGKAPGN